MKLNLHLLILTLLLFSSCKGAKEGGVPEIIGGNIPSDATDVLNQIPKKRFLSFVVDELDLNASAQDSELEIAYICNRNNEPFSVLVNEVEVQTIECGEENVVKDWGAKDSKLLSQKKRLEIRDKVISKYKNHIEISTPK